MNANKFDKGELVSYFPQAWIWPLDESRRTIYYANIKNAFNAKATLDAFIQEYTPHCIWTQPYAPAKDKQKSNDHLITWRSEWSKGNANLAIYPEALQNNATIVILWVRRPDTFESDFLTYVIPQTVIRYRDEHNTVTRFFEVVNHDMIGQSLLDYALYENETLIRYKPWSSDWLELQDRLHRHHKRGFLQVLNRPFQGHHPPDPRKNYVNQPALVTAPSPPTELDSVTGSPENRSKPESERDGEDRSVIPETRKDTNEKSQVDRTLLRAHSRRRQGEEYFENLIELKSCYASNGMFDFATRVLNDYAESNDVVEPTEPASFDLLTPAQRWEYNSILCRRLNNAAPQVKTFAEFAALSDQLFPSTASKLNKTAKPPPGSGADTRDDALAEEEMLAAAFGDMAADSNGWTINGGSSSSSDLGTPPSMSEDCGSEEGVTNSAPPVHAREPSPKSHAASAFNSVTIRLKKDVVAAESRQDGRPVALAKRQSSHDLSSPRDSKRRSVSGIPHVGGVMSADERMPGAWTDDLDSVYGASSSTGSSSGSSSSRSSSSV